MTTGEEKAWADLSCLAPADVCSRSMSEFDRSAGAYAVPVFGYPVTVIPGQRMITGSHPDSELILRQLAHFSRLAILHYLVGAQCLPPSGRLVRPAELKTGGRLYAAGSHVLPLDAMAAMYGKSTDGFVRQGRRFGGLPRTYGDLAVELPPFPRLPVTLILWHGDDEFAPRCDLLFDSTCERHVPPDVLWSVAMLCVEVMLIAPPGKGRS